MTTEGSWNRSRTSTCFVSSTNVWCVPDAVVRGGGSDGGEGVGTDAGITTDDAAVVDGIAAEDVDAAEDGNAA